MNAIQAIQKSYEGYCVGYDKDRNRYDIYVSESEERQTLRILKNGTMIEIDLHEINFKFTQKNT